MAQLSRRARERRARQIIIGSIAMFVAIVVAVSAIYFFVTRPAGLDSSLCPSTGPIGHYVLLVDKTDPLNFVQKEAFSVQFKDLVQRRLSKGYLLSVFVLGEDFEQNAEPLVELCNPGSGEDASELTENVKKIRRQYEEQFLLKLQNQAEALLSPQTGKASPIFEMIQLVAINAFRKHGVSGEHRLIVVSDMLHNTPQYSMYRGALDYGEFSATDYGRKVQVNLPEVLVELHYLMNNPKLQTLRNQKFWEDHFDKAGARVVSVTPLEG